MIPKYLTSNCSSRNRCRKGVEAVETIETTFTLFEWSCKTEIMRFYITFAKRYLTLRINCHHSYTFFNSDVQSDVEKSGWKP